MKTLPNSQATFFDGMELPLMSSQAASHAKILALQESRQELKKEPAQACGLKSSDLLASYHPATSSWRTSQTCLVALLIGEGDGLAEYSETWPSAGMMRSGKTYRRQPWALPIAENASGLLPTPRSCSAMAAENIGNRVNDKFPNLESVVARSLWPTPSASDNRDRGNRSSPAIARRIAKGKQVMLSMSVDDKSGSLNPPWVEWLMGFPPGWTDLQD